MTFMVDLGRHALGHFRGQKIVEPACGSGHFYREIYRRYVAEVRAHSAKAKIAFDAAVAHAEALQHVYGRDIDPFAVQLTLLSTFLEQLKDNVRPAQGAGRPGIVGWLIVRSTPKILSIRLRSILACISTLKKQRTLPPRIIVRPAVNAR